MTTFSYPSAQEVMTIGPNEFEDISLIDLSSVLMIKDINIIKEKGFVRLYHDSDIDVYVNYELRKDKVNKLYIGDQIFIEGVCLEILQDGITISSHKKQNLN